MFLGIDIGTSEVKALLLAPDQRAIGIGHAPLAISRPHSGHSEQAPEHWWAATQAALAQLRAAHPREYAAVRAIGLSGQMHGAVLLDRKDRVLRPAILWNDTRSAAECSELMAALPGLALRAGSLALPGFTAPKLRWVARNEPQLFRQIARVLLPKDYVRLMLTGEYLSDMSDASGTLWLDVQQRRWCPALLDLCALTEAQMPQLVEGSAPGGRLRAAAASALGLAPEIVVAGGAGDNAASAVGMGAVDPGQGFLSLGTSGVLFLVTGGYRPHAAGAIHAFCHALPGRWHQMSVMLSAASALHWAAGLLGAPDAGALAEQAAALPLAARAAAPLFLPYLGGERTPHNDAAVRASLHGLEFDSDAARLAYAVMEGVAFGLKDGLAALQAAGSSAADLWLVGGGARSPFWAQLLASALDLTVHREQAAAAGGALGAARLAWLAAGGDQATVCQSPAIAASWRPDAAERELLATRYARFRSLYVPSTAAAAAAAAA